MMLAHSSLHPKAFCKETNKEIYAKMITKSIVVSGVAVLMAACAAAQANPQQPGRPQPQVTVPEAQRQQERPGTRPEAQPSSTPSESTQTPRRPSPPAEEKTSVTHHVAKIGGQQLNYTATAATYVIRADDGSPKATMFYVAYAKDGVDSSKRPVSFVYNGGPGSASLFTHMGMGP